MTEWVAQSTDRLPEADLSVHVHEGTPTSGNWVRSYVVWTHLEGDRLVAERQSWESGQLMFPSEDEPLPVRRIKRDVLGEGPIGEGQPEALFGRVIVPLLDGEWVPLEQVRAGDTITACSRSMDVTPTYVLSTEQDGSDLSMRLLDSYGHPFPGNPLRMDAREWVQVRRGYTSDE